MTVHCVCQRDKGTPVGVLTEWMFKEEKVPWIRPIHSSLFLFDSTYHTNHPPLNAIPAHPVTSVLPRQPETNHWTDHHFKWQEYNNKLKLASWSRLKIALKALPHLGTFSRITPTSTKDLRRRSSSVLDPLEQDVGWWHEFRTDSITSYQPSGLGDFTQNWLLWSLLRSPVEGVFGYLLRIEVLPCHFLPLLKWVGLLVRSTYKDISLEC